VKNNLHVNHIEEFDIEIRETNSAMKSSRAIFRTSREGPQQSRRQRHRPHRHFVLPGDILVGKVSPKSKSELTPKRSSCTPSSAAPVRT